jgi:excisionase family DNA binding protein
MGKSQKELIKGIGSHADDPMLFQSTVADALGVHPSTVGRWVESGAMPYVQLPGGQVRILRSELINWLQVNRFLHRQQEEAEAIRQRVSVMVE